MKIGGTFLKPPDRTKDGAGRQTGAVHVISRICMV